MLNTARKTYSQEHYQDESALQPLFDAQQLENLYLDCEEKRIKMNLLRQVRDFPNATVTASEAVQNDIAFVKAERVWLDAKNIYDEAIKKAAGIN